LQGEVYEAVMQDVLRLMRQKFRDEGSDEGVLATLEEVSFLFLSLCVCHPMAKRTDPCAQFASFGAESCGSMRLWRA
jgi:hypothetical protein